MGRVPVQSPLLASASWAETSKLSTASGLRMLDSYRGSLNPEVCEPWSVSGSQVQCVGFRA